MSVLSLPRRIALGGLCLAAALACGISDPAPLKVPSLIITGTWQYEASQTVGSGSAFTGFITFVKIDSSNFAGAFDGQTPDSTGALVHVTATVTGRRLDTNGVAFTFVTPNGDTIQNSGFQIDDTLSGDWANRRVALIGTFRMVREGTNDDGGGDRVISRRPRLP